MTRTADLHLGPAAQEISAEILAAIASCRLHPGTKLGEPDLISIFGVSRTVIRQSLKDLASRGIVTLERNKGAFVASPTFAEAMELHEALILVEQGIIELLCVGLNRTGVQELREQAEAQRLAISRNDQELSNRIGGDFHELLGQLSRNKVIEEVHGNLLERTRILQMLYRRDFDEAHLCNEHTRLVECIENGDMAEARQLMKDHYWRILRSYRFDDVATEGASVFEALEHVDRSNSLVRQGEMA